MHEVAPLLMYAIVNKRVRTQATSAHDRSTSAQDSETCLCACPVFAQVFVLDWSMWKFNPSQYAAPSAAALCPSTAARLHRPHCTT